MLCSYKKRVKKHKKIDIYSTVVVEGGKGEGVNEPRMIPYSEYDILQAATTVLQ
jgi:hypothetical protein